MGRGKTENRDNITITESELLAELQRFGANRNLLTDKQARRWAMRQRGMSYFAIGRLEGIDTTGAKRSVLAAEGKLKAFN